jgi:hypothetical protein
MCPTKTEGKGREGKGPKTAQCPKGQTTGQPKGAPEQQAPPLPPPNTHTGVGAERASVCGRSTYHGAVLPVDRLDDGQEAFTVPLLYDFPALIKVPGDLLLLLVFPILHKKRGGLHA